MSIWEMCVCVCRIEYKGNILKAMRVLEIYGGVEKKSGKCVR